MTTMEDRYAANMAVLAANPHLAMLPEQLNNVPMTNIQLVPSGDAHLYGQAWDVAQQQWVALCHPHAPIEEAERDVEQLWSKDAKIFCLLGLGLGYFAAAFARRLLPYQRLVVWDVDPVMYKAMMYCVDTTPLFTDKRVDMMIGPEILTQVEPWWLHLDATDKLHIMPPMRAGYTNVCQKAAYDALLEKTVDMMRFHAVGLATWRAFGGCIGDNDLENMPEYFTSPGYEHLAGLWQNRPAVCVAAGPSLQKNLRCLTDRTVRERVAVISAGTVYALMQGLHLPPDIVTTIDFQRLNWTDQFQYVPLDPECPLVYLHSTYPQTVRRWPGPKFVAENASDTVGWLRKYGDNKKSAAQVQTVAHLNLLVALEMGANPVLLIGQDLAMPYDAHHAAGARAQDSTPSESPAEAFIPMPGYDGQMTQTRHSFLSMKTVFERIIAEHPETTFINCTEGGLPLAGAQNMPLKDALAQYATVEPPAAPLRQSIQARWQAYTPTISPTLLEDFRALQAHVEDLARFSRNVIAHAREMGLHTQALRAYVLQQETLLQARQTAFSLFAIRHFGIIELLGAIPPAPDACATDEAREAINCARLVKVAEMIREELPHIRRVLRRTERRLRDVCGEVPRDEPRRAVRRLLARQHYRLAWQRATRRASLRFQAHLLYHTQQYAAADVLLAMCGGAEAKRARIRRHLMQWKTDVLAAMPAYFLPVSQPQPAAQPEYCGAALGA